MPSITFLTTALAYAGAETQVVHLALALKARGWTVEVVTMVAPRAYVAELQAAQIGVYSLDMRPGYPDPRAIFILVHHLRRTHPQIVHSHMVHANVLARITRPFCSVPVLISTAHNMSEGGRWREWAYRLTDPLSDLTTNVSHTAVQRYIAVGAVPQGRLRMMPNGVDTHRFRPAPTVRAQYRHALKLGTEFVWLAVGRFDAVKSYPVLLNAFARLHHHHPAVQLLLVGEGPLQLEARALVAELGLSERVRFLGLRGDIPALMNAADGFVLSSAWEGLPMVLLEAGASGLPIVATDVGGNREAIAPVGGLLTAPHDPASLAGAMARVTVLPAVVRQQMGQAGREHVVNHYDLPLVVDRWEALYCELLTRRGLHV
ncbi:MAG: glycosyltransferase [Herpetosiphonaceae bacterium]|nr:glycosyltransferase [Herpetosiphonaceae bacterium]